jgi:catechol 2,3-dioxygenase-like lactoylglutathione lyase family enzyme
MKFNHLDLPVRNVPAVAAFFTRYFAMTALVARDDFTLLVDGEGFSLVLNGLGAEHAAAFPRGFHVGFNVAQAEEVEDLHARLLADQVPMSRPLGWLAGALTFQCQASDELAVEVGWRPPM